MAFITLKLFIKITSNMLVEKKKASQNKMEQQRLKLI